ncbi:hypothetical protein FRB90_008205 [Tulasnella sp. 427]|nr:hypothetical protein FRB90_008205 [Tulasnella sp. 427]
MATAKHSKTPAKRSATPVPSHSVGHHSTGSTPNRLQTVAAKDNNTRRHVDPQLLTNLHGKMFSAPPQHFIRNLMYEQVTDTEAGQTSPSEQDRYELDKRLAARCFVALKERRTNAEFNQVVECISTEYGFTDVESAISPFRMHQGFIKLNSAKGEKPLYNPLVAILEFINHFFRVYFDGHEENGENSLGDVGENEEEEEAQDDVGENEEENTDEADSWSSEIDKSWPVAICPKSPDTSVPDVPNLLRRTFVNTDGWTFPFSAQVKHPATLHPDLSLVLCQKSDIAEFAKIRKAMDSEAKMSAKAKGKKKTKPTVGRMHWKDVKVPIEVKPGCKLDSKSLTQIARYAEAVKTEQFDRHFAFSLIISRTNCRIFHWGASRCHVAEVDIVNDTATFIHIIGRLASMDPESMGYDPSFSNAGRVLAKESRTMETVLEIEAHEPVEYYDEPSEFKKVIKLHLFIDKPLHTHLGLFSRCTRVWEAREVSDTDWASGAVRVIKQNWADIERTNEAFLYEKARQIPNVARLEGYESLANSDICLEEQDILGEWRKGPRRKVKPHEIDEPLHGARLKLYLRSDQESEEKDEDEEVADEEVVDEDEDEGDDGDEKDAAHKEENGVNEEEDDEEAIEVDGTEEGTQDGRQSEDEHDSDREADEVRGASRDVEEDQDSDEQSDGSEQAEGSEREGTDDQDERSSETEQSSEYPRTIRRILIRMVFSEKGRSILKVKDCRELLEATNLWLKALFALKLAGIIHRDVSLGNLMLNESCQDSGAGQSAEDSHTSGPFIIDLGLAIWLVQSSDAPPVPGIGNRSKAHSRAHVHLTGTLPFISRKALRARLNVQPHKHTLWDDIESVFWVLLYLTLFEERTESARRQFKKLQSSDLGTVFDAKQYFFQSLLDPMYEDHVNLRGRFTDLGPFLYRFSGIIVRAGDEEAALEEITKLIDETLEGLPNNSGKIGYAARSKVASRSKSTLKHKATSKSKRTKESEDPSTSKAGKKPKKTSQPNRMESSADASHSKAMTQLDPAHSTESAPPKRKRGQVQEQSPTGASKSKKRNIEQQ